MAVKVAASRVAAKEYKEYFLNGRSKNFVYR